MAESRGIYLALQRWMIGDCIDKYEDQLEKQLVKFVFRFFIINALVYSFVSIFSFWGGSYFELEIVLLSILFDIGLLFSLKIKGDYKLPSKVYVIYTLFTLSILMLAMREAHIMIIVWYLIPLIFSHLVLGRNWFLATLGYSLLLLSVIIYLRVNHIELLDHNLMGKYNLDFATPISVFPAVAMLWMLFTVTAKNEITADQIIKRQERELFESKLLKDNIISVVAHDLKSPISSMKGLISILEMELTKGANGNPSDINLYVDKMKVVCGYSDNLICQLLDIEKLKSGKDVLEFERLDAISLLETVVLTNTALINNKGISLSTFVEEGLSIYGNELRLQQVLNNLISNAVKFSYPKSKIEIKIHREEEESVSISVKDYGIGIPKVQQSIIFDKFTKAKRTGTFGEKTHGLGLSIVHRIVELHQGTISIESDVDKGTTFYIRLKSA